MIRIVTIVSGLLTVVCAAQAAGWESVRRIAPDQKIEVTTKQRETARGVFVSASGSAILVRSTTGERSIARADIRRIRVSDPSKRARNALIWGAVGAGAGLGIGFAVCPHCANEGAGGKYTGPLTAAGAGVGALAGLLPAPYRTVYRE